MTSAEKQAYLSAMGIEVWMLRTDEDLVTPVETSPAPIVEKEPAPEPVAEHPIVPEATPRFRIAMLHYETVGICVAMTQDADVPRRFCDDLARVVGGNLEGMKFQDLKWPMLESNAVDQSLQAAREVVTMKIGQLPPRLILVGDVAEYYGPAASAQPLQVSQSGRQELLLVPDLSALMNDVAMKRRLFPVLLNWRHG